MRFAVRMLRYARSSSDVYTTFIASAYSSAVKLLRDIEKSAKRSFVRRLVAILRRDFTLSPPESSVSRTRLPSFSPSPTSRSGFPEHFCGECSRRTRQKKAPQSHATSFRKGRGRLL